MQQEEESRREWILPLFRQAGKSNANNKTYQFWQNDNHTFELYSNDMIEQKLNYIHENPVRAGIVKYPEDFIYSSASNYADMESLLDVTTI